MDETPSLSGSSIVKHLHVLRGVGFCRLQASASPRARVLHDAYRMFTLTVVVAYFLQEVVYAYQWRSDMDRLARVLFLLLCHITSLVKQIVFIVDADRIDRIIAGLDEPLYNHRGSAQRALLWRTARSAARLECTYSGAAVVTCVLWIVFPVVYHLRGQAVEFPFWTGFQYKSSSMFFPVLIYSFYVTTLVGIANTTMDAFMATILYQCKTQLRILRTNLEGLPDEARARARRGDGGGGGGDYETILMELFADCLRHYNKITMNVQSLIDIFGVVLTIQFGISGWIICISAYKIVGLQLLSVEFASMVLFISCILTELFLYCYYGNEVTFESNLLMQSLYGMQWIQTPLRFKRSLILVMERAKRPLRPIAQHLIPLSLNTFVTILKSSYSFYAVLRRTK